MHALASWASVAFVMAAWWNSTAQRAVQCADNVETPCEGCKLQGCQQRCCMGSLQATRMMPMLC